MPQTDAPETGDEREDDELSWLAPPAEKPRRDVIMSMRVTVGERDQIERTASALGVTPSAYFRARILHPDQSNVGAWRAVYSHLLTLDEAVSQGTDPSEAIQEFRRAFRDIARSAFPDAD